MIRSGRWQLPSLLATAVLLAIGAVGPSAGGQAPDERDAVIARQGALIAEQQALITAQESLLNAYRCLFDIDTQLVPNGCPEQDRPTPTATPAPPPTPTPSATPTATPTPTPTATPTPTPIAVPTPTPTPTPIAVPTPTPTPTPIAVPTPTPTPTPTPLADPTIPEGTTEEQWEQLRQCNSDGNYQYANPNGANFGAYEFRQASWDDIARQNHPHLVGVAPNEAAPADQDRMAYALYEVRGWAPWPSCRPSSPQPESTASADPADFPPIPTGTTQAQWDHLIQCESGGNYRAYNPAGPYLGAFQFHQGTWNGVASRNYPRLTGVDPRDASPVDQHRMAYALYEESGWGPWPACTAAFTSP